MKNLHKLLLSCFVVPILFSQNLSCMEKEMSERTPLVSVLSKDVERSIKEAVENYGDNVAIVVVEPERVVGASATHYSWRDFLRGICSRKSLMVVSSFVIMGIALIIIFILREYHGKRIVQPTPTQAFI